MYQFGDHRLVSVDAPTVKEKSLTVTFMPSDGNAATAQEAHRDLRRRLRAEGYRLDLCVLSDGEPCWKVMPKGAMT